MIKFTWNRNVNGKAIITLSNALVHFYYLQVGEITEVYGERFIRSYSVMISDVEGFRSFIASDLVFGLLAGLFRFSLFLTFCHSFESN